MIGVSFSGGSTYYLSTLPQDVNQPRTLENFFKSSTVRHQREAFK